MPNSRLIITHTVKGKAFQKHADRVFIGKEKKGSRKTQLVSYINLATEIPTYKMQT
jgi:hypothetical protein